MDVGVWKGIRILLGAPVNLNKFFNPSTPSMRKVDDEENKTSWD